MWGQAGSSPLELVPLQPAPAPALSQARKRHHVLQAADSLFPKVPSLANSPSPCCAGIVDDEVSALVPKMKRMRLRPTLGQLRLLREAEEAVNFSKFDGVEICIQPEQLRALVSLGGYFVQLAQTVKLEISFPAQYPHRPPKVTQAAPKTPLPFWKYEGQLVTLSRLEDVQWSPTMGVVDIVQDLIRCLPGGASCLHENFSMVPSRCTAVVASQAEDGPGNCSRRDSDDVEMANKGESANAE